MDVNEYQKSAMTTLNPTLDRKDVLINSVMGLCGESGEAIDIVKKMADAGTRIGQGTSDKGTWRRSMVSGRSSYRIGCAVGNRISRES